MKNYFAKITFGFMNGDTAMVDCSLIIYRNSFDWNVYNSIKPLLRTKFQSKKKESGHRAMAREWQRPFFWNNFNQTVNIFNNY